MLIEQRLEDMGFGMASGLDRPSGGRSPFQWAAVHGDRASVSGHEPLAPEGGPVNRLGRVPTEVSMEQAQDSARLAALDLLASLRSVLGDLDRVGSWLAVVAFVNADPSFLAIDLAMVPASDLILALYGPEAGGHARRAVRVSVTSLNLPLSLVAELEIRD